MDTKPQVLIVDDDTKWQEIYREALEDRYEIYIVGDKHSALSALDQKFFNAAIVDLKLTKDDKNRDGLDVIRRIWSLDEGTRAIVGSGYVDVSMFDEFQKMGIFSLTEIPTIARKQINSIEFFNGIIKKNDPLQKILDTVDKAVEESWRKSIKQQWSQSPFNLVKDFPAKDIQRLLRVGKIEEIRPFLSSLVRPFFPWLLPKTGNTTQVIDEGGRTIAFEAVCWSRAKGGGIAVRFGVHDNFEKSINVTPIASAYSKTNSIKILKNSIILSQLVSSPLEGRVYELTDMKFSEHFDPPLRKKDL